MVLILGIAIALWVFFDARSRKMDQAVLWAIGTSLLMILVIPFYFAKRPLKDGEVREGGTAWNVIKTFAIFWTAFMFVAGVSSMMAVGDAVTETGSGAEQAGAAIGGVIGMGMIMGLWFIVVVGALVVGLFVKKSSIVEKGPTGALALAGRINAESQGVGQTAAPTQPQKSINTLGWIGIGFLGLIMAAITISSYQRYAEKQNKLRGSNTSSATTSSPPSPVSETVLSPEPEVPGSQWSYSQDADAMSKGTTYHAVVSSSNTVDFDFPYSGAQHATLNLRVDPRYGKDVIFSIEKGQILCNSYEDCTVLVRFDDEQASNFTAVGAADNSTDTIFIRNYGRFVEKMLKAKRVRISTNIYQEGAPVFEFDVSGFDQNEYKPKK